MNSDAVPARETSVPRGGKPYRLSFLDRLIALNQRPYLDVHVADHCNLRCRGCVHFAPLAEEHFLDLDEFERDLDCLGSVPGIGKYFFQLSLMGGEPLLHPRLNEVLTLARRYLSDMDISLVSNGILLRTMGEGFWNAMETADIELILSPYPLKIDYQALLELVGSRGVRAALTGDVTGSGRGKEVFFKLAINPDGTHDPQYEFNRCPFGGRTMQLRKGALWLCQIAGHHETLNRALGCDIRSEESDRLLLDDIKTTGQIDEFRRQAHPLCRYCDNDRLMVTAWQRSRREPGEWLVGQA